MLDHAIINASHRLARAGLCYTERQLYYELCRALRPLPLPQRAGVAWLTLGGAIAASSAVRRPWQAGARLGAATTLGGGLYLLRRLPFTLPPPLSLERFAAVLGRLLACGAALPGLLPPPAAQALPTAPSELVAFGLPRLLVCEDAALAVMLRANGIPLELGCPVLSLAEACPLPSAATQMLALAGGRVALLHDASPAGLDLPARLPALLGLPQGLGWVALGLRPAHALRLHLFIHPESASAPRPSPPPDLSPRERRWLAAGRRAELQAIPPLRLIRALRRLLSPEPPPPSRIAQLRRLPDLGYMSWPTS
jgi:hypothetical protein